MTRLDRVAGCGLAAVDACVPVYLRQGVASFGGIITCGSVWACPVCSASVRQGRAEVVEARAKSWLAAGRGLVFLTLTVPHTTDDDLEVLLDRVMAGWRRVQQQRALRVVLAEFGYAGPLRATEITHGYNGWHPHQHLLLWFERPLTVDEVAVVEEVVYREWSAATVNERGDMASREHGVRAVRVGSAARDGEALAAYLVKLQDGYGKWSAASEMMRGDLKKGRSRHRTPFEIAERACDGDKRALALWRRYEVATKGRRCMQWGQRLSARLKAEEASCLETGMEDSGCVVVELSRWEWNALRGYHLELRFLTAVETGGASAGFDVLGGVFRRIRFDRTRGAPPRLSRVDEVA